MAGRNKVARLVQGFVRRYLEDVRPQAAEVNGEPALLSWDGDTLVGVMAFEIDGDEIATLRSVANPDKLRYLARQIRG